jgi:hypothetical protein
MGSCMPACHAWYNGNVTFEYCQEVCETVYCGPNPNPGVCWF